MSKIYFHPYRDPHFKGTDEDRQRVLKMSKTLYIGNMSFSTTESQVYELFSRCGEISNLVMGLDKFKLTPCGFCFVEYDQRSEAEDAMRYLNSTRLDDRVITVDWDTGFVEGRQYGRGKTGGQVRDELRTNYDEQRGGFGKVLSKEIMLKNKIVKQILKE
ncbi:nuclear cap-binding protein subunit 2-like [Teleopsis dalmanni]|uniref:nuclear cap-binding protein subunit 2-like n=1 Tax=Teleopsis dalmanni TaxID=139649 RepID=UPI0018CDCBEB|nr:nuclear cap-binding protein subunit 2-like [Teleopsis dalmanni]